MPTKTRQTKAKAKTKATEAQAHATIPGADAGAHNEANYVKLAEFAARVAEAQQAAAAVETVETVETVAVETKATEAQAPAPTETPVDESRSPGVTCSIPTNHFSDDELRRLQHAGETAKRIKTDYTRCREDWLKVVGPEMVMVRERIFEVTGATKRTDQAYRSVVNETLERYGLGEDGIGKGTRWYIFKIMDNLAKVEAWLAERPNADRLNHPKSIWQAWYNSDVTEWADDPGVDPEDEEEYWGREPEEPPVEVDCAHCGRKTIYFVQRAEGRYCLDCNYADPEGAIAGDDKDGGDGQTRGDGDGNKPKAKTRKAKDRADKDRAGDDEARGDDQTRGDDNGADQSTEAPTTEAPTTQADQDGTYWIYRDYERDFDNLDWPLESITNDLRETTDLSTIEADDRTKAIERLERVITKARGCINALETNDKKHLDPDDDDDDDPAPTTVPDDDGQEEDRADAPTTAAPDPAPPTVPDDDDPTTPIKVPRKTFKKALKAAGNNLRKVKIPDPERGP